MAYFYCLVQYQLLGERDAVQTENRPLLQKIPVGVFFVALGYYYSRE